MPIRRRAAILLLAAFAATGGGAKDKRQGYLAGGAFDTLAVLPPAPTDGDPRDVADRAIFRATRAMIGTPRYAMATADVDYHDAALMRDFSCAAGTTLTPAALPATQHLLDRAGADTARQSSIAKEHFRRLRPFQVASGTICQPESELAGNFDYPSGHTTLGWTWALILADLLPDHATAILARGRAFGASRFVCGAHNYSAVEAGYMVADATLAAVRATAAYQADLVAARAELHKLAAPKLTGCEEEARLVAMPLP